MFGNILSRQCNARILDVASFLVIVSVVMENIVQCSKCQDPGTIAHGSRIFLQERRLVQFVCNQGYQPLGNQLLSCLNGQWRGKIPVCIAPGCPRKLHVRNTVKVEEMKGALLRYLCHPGFEMRGEAVIYCDGHHWSGEPPICERTTQQVSIPSPANAVQTPEDTYNVEGSNRATEQPPLLPHSPSRNGGDSTVEKPRFVDSSAERPRAFQPRNFRRVLPLYRRSNTQIEMNGDSVSGRPANPQQRWRQQQWPGRFPSYPNHLQLNSYGQQFRDFPRNYPPTYPNYPSYAGVRLRFPQPEPQRYNPPKSVYTPQIKPFYTGESLPPVVYSPERPQKNMLINEHRNEIASHRHQETKDVRVNKTVISLPRKQIPAEPQTSSTTNHVPCPPPRKPRGGYHITRSLPDGNEDEDYFYYIEYHCVPGLILVGGNKKSYCKKNGQWTGTLPTCEDEKTICAKGFERSRSGTCKDIDECLEENGGCMHKCINFAGGYKCECNHGHKINEDGLTCIDINECFTSDLNPCEQLCQNTFGSYRCTCHAGQQLDEDGINCSERCSPGYLLEIDSVTGREICVDEDECLESNGPRPIKCAQLCVNLPGSYKCACLPGFKLTDDGLKCEEERRWKQEEVVETQEHIQCPNNSNAHKINSTDIVECRCLPGYRGSPELLIPCTDINECEDDNYGCSHSCINTFGSVYCECPAGYELGLDGRNCNDVDECNSNNGGCSATCHNYDGGYRCSCQQSSRIGEDGKTCIPVQGTCPPLQRLEKGRVLPTEPCLGQSPIEEGRVCLYACQSGYKIVGPSRRLCRQGGWTGSSPKCVAEGWCPSMVIQPGLKVTPSTCAENGSRPWLRCVFICKQPNHVMIGSKSARCGLNHRWSSNPPKCVEKSPTHPMIPRIECPRDMDVDLAPGESVANVTLPEPVTNMQIIEQRNDGRASFNSFPAGLTRVRFTAFTNDRVRQASCETRVRVRDKESPVIRRCPGALSIESAEEYPEVDWETPLFSDNVRITDVRQTRVPGGKITWGVYSVSYTASDAEGNTAECAFTVNIRRPLDLKQRRASSCGSPQGPKNGKTDCQKWAHGIYCVASCNPGYAFERRPTAYVCDEDGEWTPSNLIPDCNDIRAIGKQPTSQPSLLGQTTQKTYVSSESVSLMREDMPDGNSVKRDRNTTIGPNEANTDKRERIASVKHVGQSNSSSLSINRSRMTTNSTFSNSTRPVGPEIKFIPKPRYYRYPIEKSDGNYITRNNYVNRKVPVRHGRRPTHTRPSGTTHLRTTDCPTGQEPKVSSSGSITCVECKQGTFRPRVSLILKCMPCSAGFYQDKAGMGFCFQCPRRAAAGVLSIQRNAVGLQSVAECMGPINRNRVGHTGT